MSPGYGLVNQRQAQLVCFTVWRKGAGKGGGGEVSVRVVGRKWRRGGTESRMWPTQAHELASSFALLFGKRGRQGKAARAGQKGYMNVIGFA